MIVLLQRPLCLGIATEPEKQQPEKNCPHAVHTSQLKAGVSLKILLKSLCDKGEEQLPSCQRAHGGVGGAGEAFHGKPTA